MERKITSIGISQSGAFDGVAFLRNEFDKAIFQKGYHVFWDKVIMCPCKKQGINSHESNCRNCGGRGFVVAERIHTKMLITSINLDTKFKDWSIEKMGTVNISAYSGLYLTYQDKVTLLETLVSNNEILYLKKTPDNSRFYSFSYYPIKEIEKVYLFDSLTTKLIPLSNDLFEIEDEKIFVNYDFGLNENPVLSIKYKYNPQYSIIDNTREIMRAPIKNALKMEEIVDMPVSGIGRRMHLINDKNNYAGDYLLDNTQ